MSRSQMTEKPVFLPERTTIGILGAGQLGRMSAMAAKQLGYNVHVFTNGNATEPACQVADTCTVAAYDDLSALQTFAQAVDVVTLEFENIPVATVEALTRHVPVRPGANVLAVTQDRNAEKSFIALQGIGTAPFARVKTLADLQAAVARIGTPAVLKTARLGYDGKGQARIDQTTDLAQVFESLNGQEAILEGFIDFSREISIIAARNASGDIACYPVIENRHANHILDISIAQPNDPAQREAEGIAHRLLDALDYVGLLCIEFFQTASGSLLVNELAPRPHNSGHLTIEAATTSQFEQHIRAVCNLPLGETDIARPAAMANLLGDLWSNGQPDWAPLLHNFPDVKLHLYGKAQARAGRKMGHLTYIADTPHAATNRLTSARSLLGCFS